MMQQTSLWSFARGENEGIFKGDEKLVLDLLEKFPEGKTDSELSELFKADYEASGRVGRFKWPPSNVSARRKKLVSLGKVFAARLKVNIHTNRTNIVWVACVHRPLCESLGFEESESVSGRLPPFNPSSKPSYSQEVKV